MNRILVACFAACAALFAASPAIGETSRVSPETCEVSLEIANVSPQSGAVYLAVYNSEKGYKKGEAFLSRKVAADERVAKLSLSLPEGEYLFSVYQDLNENGKLDTNIVGMPKEPVGLSNYSGKGIPGGFDKLKLAISGTAATVTVTLVKI